MSGTRIKFVGLVVALLTIAAAATWYFRFAHDLDKLLAQAEAAFTANENDQADSYVRQALAIEPESGRALWIAGQLAKRLKRTKEATELWMRISDREPTYTQARLECGSMAIELGHLSLAEQCYRGVLTKEPSDPEANVKLVYVLRLQGRNWECRPFVHQLVQQGKFEREHFYATLSYEWVWLDPREIQYLEYCHLQGYDGLLPLVGPSRWTLTNDVAAEKPLEVLRQLAAGEPPNVDAIAWYGAILAANRRDEEFLRWQTQRSQLAENHPQTWYARAEYLDRLGYYTEASRCFWEVVRRDPNHRPATYQLGRRLAELGFANEATPYLHRAEKLAALDQLVHTGKKQLDNPSPATIRQMIDLLKDLDRSWEALGWLKLLQNDTTNREDLTSLERDLRSKGQGESEPQSLASLGLPSLDWGKFGLPTADAFLPPRSSEQSPSKVSARMQFAEEAAAAGLVFQYFNGTSLNDEAGRMFEFSGGGVGVIDFDLDGYPDVYFTQGCNWPPDRSPTHRDALFRNLGGRSFKQITESARIEELDFSHGITVGDFNNDGFPDLFVGNIGPNRLFENLGDGTFRDVTATAGVAGNEWTLAAAFGDLNQDSVPDLHVVNYLGGPDVFTRVCDFQGKPVQCLAGTFAGEMDRLYLGRGDGSFEDVSVDSSVGTTIGKGMGIVAGNILGDGRISLYVANDGMTNKLWRPAVASSAGRLGCEDVGMLLGVGTNDHGQAQASMGIASGDLNGDGILDLFVTNFYKETNNLFLSDSSGGYRDDAQRAQVLDPDRGTMGWGAQFFDADLDGDLDLVVANGHLSLRSSRGDPNRMRPHLWRNESRDGQIRFAMVSGGAYFEQVFLGRGVAVLDWNRDGQPDACITHVDQPAALLTNRSERLGHFLVLSLIGVESERDAIGTTVKAELSDQVLVRHVTSGDGFAASNDKCMLIGMGSNEVVRKVTIRWPSGRQEEHTNVAVDGSYIAIEGDSILRVHGPSMQ